MNCIQYFQVRHVCLTQGWMIGAGTYVLEERGLPRRYYIVGKLQSMQLHDLWLDDCAVWSLRNASKAEIAKLITCDIFSASSLLIQSRQEDSCTPSNYQTLTGFRWAVNSGVF